MSLKPSRPTAGFNCAAVVGCAASASSAPNQKSATRLEAMAHAARRTTTSAATRAVPSSPGNDRNVIDALSRIAALQTGGLVIEFVIGCKARGDSLAGRCMRRRGGRGGCFARRRCPRGPRARTLCGCRRGRARRGGGRTRAPRRWSARIRENESAEGGGSPRTRQAEACAAESGAVANGLEVVGHQQNTENENSTYQREAGYGKRSE